VFDEGEGGERRELASVPWADCSLGGRPLPVIGEHHDPDTVQRKQTARDRTWAALQRAGVLVDRASDHIPDFRGKDEAAERLARTKEWLEASAVVVTPDDALGPVRVIALRDGKRLYMPAPGLTAKEPFVLLEPSQVKTTEIVATDLGAMEAGQPVEVEDLDHVDLMVCGSVVVDRRGVRLGKGSGYSDLEIGLLLDSCRIDHRSCLSTVVHDLQVVSDELPEEAHDFRMDLVVTPQELLRLPKRILRSSGILWERLERKRMDRMPALAKRFPGTHSSEP
jgi:5-formyltetrahydrofolate cyclo-ligase